MRLRLGKVILAAEAAVNLSLTLSLSRAVGSLLCAASGGRLRLIARVRLRLAFRLPLAAPLPAFAAGAACDAHAVAVFEQIGAARDDRVAGLQAAEHFDFVFLRETGFDC